MECTDARDLLDAYALGDLPALERANVEAHLNQCAGCREDHRGRAALLGQVRAAMRHPLPVSRLADLRHHILAERTERQKALLVREGLRRMVQRTVALAAAMVLVAWSAGKLADGLRGRSMSPEAIEASIIQLVHSAGEDTKDRGYLMSHRVSIERYLELAAGTPMPEPAAKPATSEPAEAHVKPDGRFGAEDRIEALWAPRQSA